MLAILAAQPHDIQQLNQTCFCVCCRITIYNDFNVQIGEKVREQKGEAIPAIRANATAKPWYGHAAVIVGYGERFLFMIRDAPLK